MLWSNKELDITELEWGGVRGRASVLTPVQQRRMVANSAAGMGGVHHMTEMGRGLARLGDGSSLV
jgi:hypothetical protein